MNRLVIALLILLTVLVFATCERSDMYNMAMYGLAPKSAIYLYHIGTFSGDAGSDNDADSNCYTAGILYLSFLGTSRVKAFRSYSIAKDIRFILPTQYWHYPVLGISQALTVTPLSSTWAGLWDGVLDNPINTSLGMPLGSFWWSGSNTDGNTSINTCNEWNESDPALSGQAGGAGISDATMTCDNNLYLICVAY